MQGPLAFGLDGSLAGLTPGAQQGLSGAFRAGSKAMGEMEKGLKPPPAPEAPKAGAFAPPQRSATPGMGQRVPGDWLMRGMR